ncbi:MAG: phage holin family protein [Clostridia bacterium]|nr:phage holin family protein [Clostridia bacterium]
MDKLKYVLAIAGGTVAAYFQQYIILYVLVGIACLLDLFTGISAAVKEGTGLSSDIARKGFLKKLVLLVAVGFGTYLDFLAHYAAEKAGLPFDTLIFSSVICVYICITECISIIENICRVTGGAIPDWIKKLLKQHKETLEKGGGENGPTEKH